MKDKLLAAVSSAVTSQTAAIGNDLVFLPDFRLSCTDLFKSKVYTGHELAYCQLFDDALLRYASTWAAKEAVYKAVKQLDDSTLAWRDIEIRRDKIGGRPRVVLHSKPEFPAVSLTIAHDGDYVWAAAFINANALNR
jgi:phosphopantetheine--protein transferase-like protein